MSEAPESAIDASEESAVAQFEWVLARFLVAARLAGAMTVVVNVRAGREQLRRPRLATAVAGLTVLHAGWATARTLRQRRIGDPALAASEIPLGIGLLLAEAFVYDPSGLGAGPRLGTDYVGIAAGLAAAELARPAWIMGSIACLGAVKVGVATRTRERGSVTLQGTLFDLLVMAEGLMAHVVVSQVRAQAAALDAAHDRESRQTTRLAGEREQLRHHRLVHDRVLQTLEVVAGQWDLDDDQTRERLRLESQQLRELIGGEGPRPAADLLDVLAALAGEFAGRDLRVEVRSSLAGVVLDAPAHDAALGATREALENVCKHAGVDRAEISVEDRTVSGWP